ncbi:hypothetical protein BVC80_9075g83 [Macleaya cordata]|uniref:Uncharacterized protein n=1 Tax=Macleaya cordata TaxID=56857 RepID=A0A200PUG7_MACCD|nr:hypothetical protein BVC80_9075g83 [Macleaya cordata]
MLQDLPRKKAKDKVSGRIKSTFEKGKKREKTQLTAGTDGLIGQVSVGATETTSRPPMTSVTPSVPFYPSRPWTIPHYPQGSIEQVEQANLSHAETESAQCRLMSGGWSGPPSCPGEILPPNVIGCPETSSPHGLPFRPAGPSNVPQMPCIYPHAYSEGPTRLVDQATLQHGTSTTQSSQGFIGFLTQRSTSHRLSESSMQMSPRRQDFLEPPAP